MASQHEHDVAHEVDGVVPHHGAPGPGGLHRLLLVPGRDGRAPHIGRSPRQIDRHPFSSCFLTCADPTAGSRTSDRKSTRLNSSHVAISYAVFCLKKKKYT